MKNKLLLPFLIVISLAIGFLSAFLFYGHNKKVPLQARFMGNKINSDTAFKPTLVRVDDKIGVGTSDPQANLHVEGSFFARYTDTSSSGKYDGDNHFSLGNGYNSAPNNGFKGYGSMAFIKGDSAVHLYTNYFQIWIDSRSYPEFEIVMDSSLFMNLFLVSVGVAQRPAKLAIVDGTQGAGKFFSSDANGLGSWKAISVQGVYTDTTGALSFDGKHPFAVHGNNAIQYTDGGQALGKVLTSDASGNASWQSSARFSSYTTSASNGQTVINIPHGLGSTPAYFGVTPVSSGSQGYDNIAVNSKDIVITYSSGRKKGSSLVYQYYVK